MLTTMDIRGIVDLLPHRYPFLLVDRVLEFEPGRRIVAIKNVTINEQFFLGHFPGVPVMPGVLILEALAQAGAVLLLGDVPDRGSKLVYFTGVDEARFRRPSCGRPAPVVHGGAEAALAQLQDARDRGSRRRDRRGGRNHVGPCREVTR